MQAHIDTAFDFMGRLFTDYLVLTGYWALVPALLLLCALFWGLFANFLPGKDRGASAVGFVCALLAAATSALIEPGTQLFGGRFFYTFDARFAAITICVLAALWCLWTLGSGVGRTREAIALAMFSSIGASFAVAATDLIVLFLVLELASMPGYVLIGYRRYRIAGLEAALKYFLLSVLSTLIMLYGLSFLVGLAQGTTFAALNNLPDTPLTFVAVGLVLLGLLAKISAAPFHWWAPDAYEGAEPWAIAFASVVPKVAATLVAIRLILVVAASTPMLHMLLMITAIVSLIVGAFAALQQKDIRRMMAYSGVVTGGYILIALTIISLGGPYAQTAFYAAVFYVAVYALASMGVLLIAAHEGGRVSDLSGLAERNPYLAWCLVILVLSMIGVPPLVGFFAKLNLFLVAIDVGLVEIVILAVVVAVVSAFYYLRLIRAAFFGEKPAVAADVATMTSGDADEAVDADEVATAAELDSAEDSEPAATVGAVSDAIEQADCTEKSPYSTAAHITIGIIVAMIVLMGIFSHFAMNFLAGS